MKFEPFLDDSDAPVCSTKHLPRRLLKAGAHAVLRKGSGQTKNMDEAATHQGDQAKKWSKEDPHLVGNEDHGLEGFEGDPLRRIEPLDPGGRDGPKGKTTQKLQTLLRRKKTTYVCKKCKVGLHIPCFEVIFIVHSYLYLGLKSLILLKKFYCFCKL